jgi:hypothetical protein
MTVFAHALVVGGSGMLAGCCRKLLDAGSQVSVMARDKRRLEAIAPAITPLVCDYTDADSFARVLETVPPPDLVVAWIHGRAPRVRRALAVRIRPGGRLVQVLGSAYADPAQPELLAVMAEAAAGLPIRHQAVVLGFVLEKGRSRWLTDSEISQGVFAAVARGDAVSVVGAVEPWASRPA